MTRPHDPDTRHLDDTPPTHGDEAVETRPPDDPASGGEAHKRRRPQVSMHPRPHLRRLGRGALALAAIAVMVLLTSLTLRYSRQSLDSIADATSPAAIDPRPLAIRRIEEMRPRLPAPTPAPLPEALPDLLPTPPPPSPASSPRDRSDHRAAWRSSLTHRTSARSAAGGPAPRERGPETWTYDDPSLPGDLAASLRDLTAAAHLANVSPAVAPPPADGGFSRPAVAPSPVPIPSDSPSPPNLLATPPAATTRWADPIVPPSPYLLRAGTLLPAVLAQRVVSDQPGLVRAVVARDVRDSLAGTSVLVPRGTVLLGRQGSLPGFGQGRLAVVWTRLLFPDGRSLDLDSAGATPAASAARDGTAGLEGRVNHHWGRRYVAAALLSLVGAGVQLSQPQSGSLLERDTPGSRAAGALGLELGRTSDDLIRRYGDLPPTIELAPGARVHAVLLQDLAFTTPYQPLHR